ncbi:prolyl oligopeptidase family serine peptidase [Novosphingobium sp. KA1]|uniref:prolyl oligopeptidase family serine peptidase n=1 Tax=Novosphingobium sp. (strain KA1) TaxID=164608 RepID=UPI001A8EEBF9|nr:prolyl oligopeptidase family serine peptidase [Novosphingobium sp. KA1]QSR19716.1 hypothetical protein CA833_21470 [Novosphingobium sp. KA1]
MPRHIGHLLAAAACLATHPCNLAAKERPRDPTLEDIVNVRSIDGLMLSPDGKSVAYRVTTPSLRDNETSVQWFAVPVDGTRPPVPLGRSQVPIWMALYDMVDLPQARWLDDHTIAALGMYDDTRQVHRLGPGDLDEPLTQDPADVVSFTVKGPRLAYTTRSDRSAIVSDQNREQRRGIRLDRTVNTDGLRLTDNFRIGSRLTTIRRQDEAFAVEAYAGPFRDREVTLPSAPIASEHRAAFLDGASLKTGVNVLKGDHGTLAVNVGPGGEDGDAFRKFTIAFTDASGNSRPCNAEFCSGLTASLKGLAFAPGTGELVAFTEQDFSDRTSINGWNPATGAFRVIRPADGSLNGGAAYGGSPCAFGKSFAICVKAGPTTPASLVRVDLAGGTIRPLAAPNAAFSERNWGEFRFLDWTDADGRKNHGVLLLPKEHGTKMPLVLTTYRCRGFLRGGTASHVAEHLLIQRGIAALCVSGNNGSLTERDAEGKRPPLGPHLAQIASYRAIIDKLAAEGLIDRRRVGISGHSFTSMVATYAISHTDLFAVAETVGNTIDPGPYFVSSPMPESFRSYLYPAMGLPLPDNDPNGEIAKASPALNARNVTAPLLMQPPESEYICALQLYSAIAARKGAVDLYVYPMEAHMGSREPQHIYWRNRRALDWFAFWLTGKEYPDPAYPDQYSHWRNMRATREETLHQSHRTAG